MERVSGPNWRGAAAVLAALFPIFALIYLGLVGTAPEQVLNSDLVQPFMIMRDFVLNPAAIWSWHLSPAIYVFPDYFFALAINALHIGPVFSMIANGALLGVLLMLAGGYLLRLAGVPDLPRAILAVFAAMLASILTALALPGDLATDMQIWLFTTFIHSGTLLSGVAMLGLWTKAEITSERSAKAYMLALVLAALSSYSDVTFLVFVVPTIGVATGIAWIVRPDAGRILRTGGMIAVSAASYLVDRFSRGNLAPGGNADIAGNILKWWAILEPHLLGNPLIAVFFLFTPVMLARAVFLFFAAIRHRSLGPGAFAEIAIAGYQTLSVAVPMLFGTNWDIWNLRYSLPIAFLPVLWLLLLSRKHLSARLKPAKTWLVATVWTATLGIAAWASLPALPKITAVPPVISCMDELSLPPAYANYWYAKGPVFLSDYSYDIATVSDKGTKYNLNTNEALFTQSIVDGGPVSYRTIIMKGLDSASIEKLYGAPVDVKECRGITFWLYDEPLPVPPD